MGNEIKLSAQELFQTAIARKAGIEDSSKINVDSIFNFDITKSKNTQSINFNTSSLTDSGLSVTNSEVIAAIKEMGAVNIFAIDGDENTFTNAEANIYDLIAEISSKSTVDDKAEKLLELIQEQFFGNNNEGVNRDVNQVVDSICSTLNISDKASVLAIVKEFAGDDYLSLSDFEDYEVNNTTATSTASTTQNTPDNDGAANTNVSSTGLVGSNHALNINTGNYNLDNSLNIANRDLNVNAEFDNKNNKKDSLSDDAVTLDTSSQKTYLKTYLGIDVSDNKYWKTNSEGQQYFEYTADGYTNCARVVNDHGTIKLINTVIDANGNAASNVYQLKYGGLEGDDVQQSTNNSKPSFGDDYVNVSNIKDANGNPKSYAGNDGLHYLAQDIYGNSSIVGQYENLSQDKIKAALLQRNADIAGIRFGHIPDGNNVYLPSTEDIANWNMDKNPAFYAQGEYAVTGKMEMVDNYQGSGTRSEAVVKDGWSSYKSGKSSITTTDILKDFYGITDTSSPIAQKIISDLKSIYNISSSSNQLPDNLEELVLPNPYADYSDFKLRESGSGSKPGTNPEPMENEARRLPGALYGGITSGDSEKAERIRNSHLYKLIQDNEIDEWANLAARCTRTVNVNGKLVKYYQVDGQWYDNEGYRTSAPTKRNGVYYA